ncbi:MAG: hypothetical protein GXO94_06660 [Nitrospirae bacterium]|nr:hypothetical protein [Nitrospirota bacterium]
MNEIEKLRRLLHHWMEHNDEHANVYRQWAGKARSFGRADVSAVLERLEQETRSLNRLLEEALEKLS